LKNDNESASHYPPILKVEYLSEKIEAVEEPMVPTDLNNKLE
jgi:hypothetical protein